MLPVIETAFTGCILSFSAVLIVPNLCVKQIVIAPDDMVLSRKNVMKLIKK